MASVAPDPGTAGVSSTTAAADEGSEVELARARWRGSGGGGGGARGSAHDAGGEVTVTGGNPRGVQARGRVNAEEEAEEEGEEEAVDDEGEGAQLRRPIPRSGSSGATSLGGALPTGDSQRWWRSPSCAAAAAIVLLALAAMLATVMGTGFARVARAVARATDAAVARATVLPSGEPELARVAVQGDFARVGVMSPAMTPSVPTATPAAGVAVVSVLSPSNKYPTTFRVVRKYRHDHTAFTQGLVWWEDASARTSTLFESTGMLGASNVRHVTLTPPGADGYGGYGMSEVVSLSDGTQFGEGITVWNGTVIQLTWQSHVGHVYQASTLQHVRTFPFTTTTKMTRQGYRNNEGWGITHNGTHLLVSDGTSRLLYWDPNTLSEVGRVTVVDAAGQGVPRPLGVGLGSEVDALNEVEYVHGWLLANVWMTDLIAVIHPTTGRCVHYLDMSSLPRQVGADVLNGIAYSMRLGPSTTDAWSETVWGGRLWVTGKYWDTMYELELGGWVEYDGAGRRAARRARSKAPSATR